MRLKLSLIQLLCLMAIAAATVHLLLLKLEGDPFWRSDTLLYVSPDVPLEYQLIEDEVVGAVAVKGELTTFDNGHALFLGAYRRGWEDVRRLFYLGGEWYQQDNAFDFYEEYDLSKLRFRATYDQFAYAYHRGRVKCCEQLDQLVSRMGESKLRHSLAYTRNWQYVPGLALAITGIAVLIWKRL